MHQLLYETLVQVDPETEEFVPYLASHWRIENDDATGTQVFWFHLNENARWADGSPVTAADVYYSWWHRVQEDRNDPMNRITYSEGYQEPEIVDRHTIKVRTKTMNWRLFLYFGASMFIYPANQVAIPGEQYLQEYNWKFVTGSGPYHLAAESDLKKGESLALTRRADWWAENEPWAPQHLQLRQGPLPRHPRRGARVRAVQEGRPRLVHRAPRTAVGRRGAARAGDPERLGQDAQDLEQGAAGLLRPRFNERVAPFNDRRVRLAFAHLFNRERLIEKLFFNEYELINSTYPGSYWGAGDTNPMILFDPGQAAALLADAGYRSATATASWSAPTASG